MSEQMGLASAEGSFAPPPRRRSRAGLVMVLALLAFVGGILATLWATGGLDRWWPRAQQALPAPVTQHNGSAQSAGAPAAPPATLAANQNLASFEGRVAALSARLDALSAQAMTAGGHATRAEGVLIVSAVRRVLDSGGTLGYLEAELRARFGEAQPRAVSTIISAAAEPVTLTDLQAGLDAIAPALIGRRGSSDWWTATKRELAHLVIVRRASAPSPAPERALERARALLVAGRVEAAMREVETLPGSSHGKSWLEKARRYNEARRALDVVEAAAILDPRATPAAMPAQTPAPAATAENATAPITP